MSRSEVAIPIPTKIFIDLVDFLRARGSDRDPADAVSAAIEFWMMHSGSTLDDVTQTSGGIASDHNSKNENLDDGFWWKGVFIPSGSKARMVYKGKTYMADVNKGGFLFDGKSRSPSEFTWAVTNTARNAWRDIELMSPLASEWVLADVYRARHS